MAASIEVVGFAGARQRPRRRDRRHRRHRPAAGRPPPPPAAIGRPPPPPSIALAAALGMGAGSLNWLDVGEGGVALLLGWLRAGFCSGFWLDFWLGFWPAPDGRSVCLEPVRSPLPYWRRDARHPRRRWADRPRRRRGRLPAGRDRRRRGRSLAPGRPRSGSSTFWPSLPRKSCRAALPAWTSVLANFWRTSSLLYFTP